MKPEQRQRIVDKHRDSLTRHGHHPHALYWSGRDIQYQRFLVLAEIGIENGDSLLDVGCGFADFHLWLQQRGLQTHFTGVDVSPDLLAYARDLHPDADFQLGDVFDIHAKAQSFDWVTLSGALNENLHDDGAYARKVIARMYTLCNKGVAFNLLNQQYIQAHDLQSHRPQEILLYCQSLCVNSELRTDYLKNDFTIYMRR